MKQNIKYKDIAFDIINIMFMILLCIVFLIPLIMVFSSSFLGLSEAAVRGSYVLYPKHFDFSAYKALLNPHSPIYRAYIITISRVLVGTFLNLLFTSTLAYGLAKRKLPGNGFFTVMIFLTMLFSGGLIPTYTVVRMLKLTNTFWSMIVPGLVGVWNLIILRTFFWQIPESLEEAATIDGASEAQILFGIFLPLSLPALATIGMFYAVGHWNAWFDSAIYISTSKMYPLQIVLRNMINSMSSNDLTSEMFGGTMPPSETIKCATIIVATAPILAVYPFVQKYFVKGAMIGAVKG